jgi:hypothetical protein
MAVLRLLTVTILSSGAWAAEQRVSVPAGGQAEARVLLSRSELRTKQALWVQADYKQIQVTVTGPDGRRWTQANSRTGSMVEVSLADRESGSSDEISLAEFLGSNGTLVGWNKIAPAGTYSVQLSGKTLAAGAEVVLRRMTMDELVQERMAADKHSKEELMTSMFAVPERRIRLDAQGRGAASLDPRIWDKNDVVIAGTTLGKKFAASVRMPDGTIVTEANAVQMGCQWQWNSGGGVMSFTFLTVGTPHLEVSCPQRMVGGAVSISIDADPQSTGAEMAVAVLSAKKFAAIFEDGDKQRAAQSGTVRLRHKFNADKGDTEGFMSATVNRATAVRITPVEGSERIASITAKAESFEIDPKKDIGVMVIGPHPSKISLGPAKAAVREADGGFVYSFVAARSGKFQVDFTAEGLFANGRRFEAIEGIRVFVGRLSARVTGVRQQRIDLDNDGKADMARFLLDIDVAQPGRYEAFIQLGNSSYDQHDFVLADQELTVGKRTMTLESDREFLSELEQNPEAQLSLHVTNRSQSSGDEFPGVVEIAATMPKAGDFRVATPLHGDTRAAGVSWRLVDTDKNGKPDRLAISTPVEVAGTNCEWSAWLEINPGTPAGLIRTVGYQQQGSFIPTAGRARIETLWNLAPFYGAGGPASAGRQAFVFRMLEARCGSNKARVEDSMSFSADLSAMETTRVAATGRVSGVAPRVVGMATLEPLDKDKDGRYDHLKVGFDLVSPGGTCIWWGHLAVRSNQDETNSQGTGGRAETKPGINHVSMELDVATSITLHDQPTFRFYVSGMECGSNPQFTSKNLEVESVHLFEQEFAIQSNQFAKLGEYKWPAVPAPKKPTVLVQLYNPPKSGRVFPVPYPPEPTTKHSVQLAIKVSDGTGRVGTVDGATVQVYSVDFDAMAKLKLRAAVGPSAAKKPMGAKVALNRRGDDVFAFEFAQRVPGYYQLDVEVTGKLADGRPFTEAWFTFLPVKTEDLRVLSVEQQAVDLDGTGKPTEARVQLTIESDIDGDIAADAKLFRGDLSEEFPTAEIDNRVHYVRVKIGTQTVTTPLPREAIGLSGGDVILLLTVQPPRRNEKDLGITYWDPNVADWTNGRNGFFPLKLKLTKSPSR